LRYLLLLLVLFCNYISISQDLASFRDDVLFYSSSKEDALAIKDVVNIFDNGGFKKDNDHKVYKNLGNNTLWYYYKVSSNDLLRKYLTIDYPYLDYGKVYIRKGQVLEALYPVTFNKEFVHDQIFYRQPIWKIPLYVDTPTEIFIEVRHNPGRVGLNILFETENEFLKRVQIEYAFFGFFIAILIAMTIMLAFFSVLKKEYVVLLYALYIVIALIEFLAGKGLGVQFFWAKSPFLVENIRSLCHITSTISMGIFYYKFYKLKRGQRWAKIIFKVGVLLMVPLVVLFIYKYFFQGLNNLNFYVQLLGLCITFSWVLNHIYLSLKKHIPIYLAITFTLPALAIVVGQATSPGIHDKVWIIFSGPNLYYVFLILEIIVFTRFIFSAVVESQLKYIELKKVSDELKYNFQNKTLEVQLKERNKLVSNVHDTFGGYLEALKLRLLNQNQNKPEKIQEILDAFYKDYRYLLNSLYAPKINADNFKISIVEFSQKLDALTEYTITCQIDMDKITLAQEKYMNLYRIISELTTNAIKYANGSEINISINQSNKNTILLIVNDNGIGFDKNELDKTGFGLSNIRERVEQMKGTLNLESNNKGTNFKIEISKNE